MNVMELLQDYMSDEVVNTLTKQIGADNPEKTKAATNGVVATLMSALSKNAQSENGVGLLASALDRDHDGSILDDVMGFVAGQSNHVNERAANGAGILKHVLGQKQDNAASMISKMSGLDKDSTFSLMAKLAPLVMGALGKQKQSQSLGGSALQALLSDTVKSNAQKQSEMSIIEKFIDQDGDGSVMDDLMNIGGGLLGKMFRK